MKSARKLNKYNFKMAEYIEKAAESPLPQLVDKVETLSALSDVFIENAPHPKGRGLGNIRADAGLAGICEGFRLCQPLLSGEALYHFGDELRFPAENCR